MKKTVLLFACLSAMRIHSFAQAACNPSVSTGVPNCAAPPTGFTPINDLGTGISPVTGLMGGLYPNGSNFRPAAHNNAGLVLASQIVPLNLAGNADLNNGKIVMLTIGMSNTNMESCELDSLASIDPCVNPKLVIVNGAMGGCTAMIIGASNPNDPCYSYYNTYWNNVNTQLGSNGVNANQVEVIWYKNTNQAGPSPCYPAPGSPQIFADSIRVQTKRIMHDIKQRFPNVKLCYIASRISARYSCSSCTNAGLNPEPYAYWQGWSMKELIQDQINGDPQLQYSGQGANSPWLSWGVYMWSDGNIPQSGNPNISWNCPADLAPDGTHPSLSGARKIGNLLLCNFKNDSTSFPWFTATGNPCPTCMPTGSPGENKKEGFGAFPNPNSGKFTVKGAGELEIFSTLGEMIFEKKLFSDRSEIDLSGLPKGVYFLRIRSLSGEERIIDQKILIQ